MPLKKRILANLLLVLYLMVGLNHSALHAHHSSCDKNTKTDADCHQHEGFDEVHHDNHFHIGVFHFLGHLFEDIGHQDDLGCNHVAPAQNVPSKKVMDNSSEVSFWFNQTASQLITVDAIALSDPPFHTSLSQKSKNPGTPLRAPPSSL